MSDGELLDGSALRVHHTPGHTPGHCSLLHEPSGTLITGDAIWNMRSRRTWPVLAFCTNAVLTEQTAATLGELEYTTAAFTHGPEIRGTRSGGDPRVPGAPQGLRPGVVDARAHHTQEPRSDRGIGRGSCMCQWVQLSLGSRSIGRRTAVDAVGDLLVALVDVDRD